MKPRAAFITAEHLAYLDALQALTVPHWAIPYLRRKFGLADQAMAEQIVEAWIERELELEPVGPVEWEPKSVALWQQPELKPPPERAPPPKRKAAKKTPRVIGRPRSRK